MPFDIAAVCRSQGPRITGITHQDQPITGASILWVIAGLESIWGAKAKFCRSEKAFSHGGPYFHVELWATYGVLASCSVGAWQVMVPVAWELGYRDDPWRLIDDPLICGYWATEYIVRRSIQRDHAKTLTDILDGYNSGTHRDAHVPTAYIARGIEIYREQPLP